MYNPHWVWRDLTASLPPPHLTDHTLTVLWATTYTTSIGPVECRFNINTDHYIQKDTKRNNGSHSLSVASCVSFCDFFRHTRKKYRKPHTQKEKYWHPQSSLNTLTHNGHSWLLYLTMQTLFEGSSPLSISYSSYLSYGNLLPPPLIGHKCGGKQLRAKKILFPIRPLS